MPFRIDGIAIAILLLILCSSTFSFAQSITGNTEFCQGSNTTLTISGAPTGSTFQWQSSVNGGVNWTNISSSTGLTLQVTTAAMYQAIVTTAGTDTTYGPVTVVENARPVADFTFTDGLCSGTATPFTSSVTGGTAPYTYLWDFGDASTSTESNPSHVFTSFGCGNKTFNVKLTVTDAKGCSFTTGTKVVTIKQAPDVGVSDQNIFSPFNNCANTSTSPVYTLTLHNASASCVSSISVNWGDGQIDNNVTFPLTHTYSQFGAYTLEVTGIGTNGCVGKKIYTVANQRNPDIGIATYGSTDSCAPLPVHIVITTWQNNSPGTTYSLNFGDGTSTKFTHPINPNVTNDTVIHTYTKSPCPLTKFQLKITATNACTDKSFTGGDIVIKTKPTVSFSAPLYACVNQSICFTNQSTPGYGANCFSTNIYEWDYGDGSPKNQNGCHTYSTPGTYTITLTGTSGCGSNTNTRTVCVTAAPIGSFDLDKTTGCGPLIVKATNTSNTLTSCAPTTYNWRVDYTATNCGTATGWSFTNGTSASSIHPEFVFTNPGTYTIKLEVSNVCGTVTSTKTVVVKRPPAVTISGLATTCGIYTISPSTNTVNCGTTPVTYAWSFPGASPLSSADPTPGIVTYTAPGTYTITLIIGNDCGTTTEMRTVTFVAKPDINTPSNLNICKDSAVTSLVFAGTLPGTTYSWSNSNTAIGLAASGNGAAIPPFTAINTGTNALSATITLTATNTTSGCSATSSFTITVNPKPTKPTTTRQIGYCQNSTAVPLTATAGTGSTLTWFDAIPFTNPLPGAPTPSTTTVGQQVFYVHQTNGFGCTSDTARIPVTIVAAIGGNTISGDIAICAGTTPAMIIGSNPAGGTNTFIYQWQRSTDNGATWTNITGANGINYSPGALSNTTQYRRIVTSSTCTSTSNPVTITVEGSLTNVNIAAAQAICAGTSPQALAGQQPTGGNNTFAYQWQSSSNNTTWTDIVGATLQDYQPGILTQNTYYKRKVTSGNCSAESNVVLITVNQLPVINAVADALACNNSNVNAINCTATPASGVTYAWTNDNVSIGLSASGNGNLPTFTATNNASPKAPMGATIVVTPTYTAGGVGCAGATDTFTITVLPQIAIAPIQDVEVCTGNAMAQVTPIIGEVPAVGSITYTWVVSGLGTTLVNGNGNSIPPFNTVNTGNTDLITTITVTPKYTYNGKTCDGTPEVYSIFVKPGTPPANAGNDVTLCAASAYTMQAVVSPNSTGTWSQVSGSSVTIVNATNASTQITGLTPGQSYSFMWTVAGFASCPTTSNTISIINRPALTVADAGDDVVLCDMVANGPNNTITLNANTDATRAYEKGEWSFAGNINGAVISNVNSPNSQVTFINPGTYTLVWKITNDAGCPPSTDTMQVFVFAKPVAGSVVANATSICSGQNAVVTASGFTGNIAFWQYQVKGGAWKDTLTNGTSIVFNNVSDTFNVRVVIASAGALQNCGSRDTSASIQINVAPPTVAGTTSPNATECKDNNNGTITLAGHTGAVVRWQSSINNGAAWTDILNMTASLVYNNLSVTSWYRAVVKSGTCAEAYSDTTIITVVPPVTAPDAGSDLFLCDVTTFILAGNTPATNETGVWQQLAGAPVTLSASNITNPVITGAAVGSYTFKWTLNNNFCPEKSDTVVVTIYPALVQSIDTASQTVCFGQPVTITGVVPSGGTTTYAYQWQQNTGTGWIDISGQTSVSITFIPTQSVQVRRLVTSGPCSDVSLAATITVQPPVENNNISASQAICINTAAQNITGTTPTGANGQYNFQWQQSSDGFSWTNITGATGINYDPGTLTTTTHYRRVVTTALCNGPQASTSNVIIVTVNPDARALFVPIIDSGCAPFAITPAVINHTAFPNNNSAYNWYIDDVLLATADVFPGYTMVNSGDTVVIKMVAISKFGCRSDSVSHTFYTITKPEPAFAASDTVGCGPLTVSFTNNTPNVQNYTYHWNFGNGITSNLPAPPPVTFATNPNFTDTIYNVNMTVFSQCDTITVSQKVRVKSKPKALFTPDKSIGCSPFTVTFSNTSKGVNISYEWLFGDGTSMLSNNQSAVQHLYTTAVQDTFYAKLVATNECGSDTQTYAIVVSPNAVRLDVAINGNQANGCKPHEVMFINNSSGATNFRWDFGDGNIRNTTANVDTVRHTYLQTGTFTVNIFASNGCSDTSTTEVVTVFAKPVVDFAFAPSPICAGDSIQFTNQSDTITGVTWRFGDGNISNLTAPKHRYATPGTYHVTLIGARQYSPGNACIDSASKWVTVLADLPGSFTVSDSVSSCVPFTVTFINTSPPSALTVWDFGNGMKDTGDVVTHTFSTVGSYQVNMTATSAGGCSYKHNKSIVVNGPAGSFSYEHGVICGSTPVRFQVNATGTDSIRYNFGDGTIITTNNRTVFHTYVQAGNYIPSVTLIAGANGTCRVLITGTDTIKVDEVKAGFREAMTKGCGSTAVAFTDTSRAYSGVAQWQWNFGNGNISTTQNPVEVYASTNNWQVQLIVKGNSGCADTTTKLLPVKVNNMPIAYIQADSTGCVNQPVFYVANVMSQDTIANYQWSFANGVVHNGTSYTNYYGVPGTFAAMLITTTNYGCSDTVITPVIIHPTPKVRASSNEQICRGDSVRLTATGAPLWSWGPLQGLNCYNCPSPVAKPVNTTSYVVTGSNQFGCANKDTVLIKVIQPFDITFSGDDTICIGQSTQLKANGAINYKWSPPTGLNRDDIATPIATPMLTTTYRVVGTDTSNCFTDTAHITVAVGQYPTIDLGPGQTLATGTRLPLQSVVTNGPITQWLWTPATDLSCNTCALPIATVKKEITYGVVATNQYHCSASDTISIKVFCESTQVFIPNLFTPDNDGINDKLIVRGTGIKTIKNFRVFNRWGELVFERSNFSPNDLSYGWDGIVKGQKAPPDVYVYTCEVLCENDVPFVYKGNTAIIK